MSNIKRWLKRETIEAISDSELKKLLIKFEIIDPDMTKKINCNICQKVIDFDEISSIILDENSLYVICQKDKCIKKLTRSELK